MGKIVVKRHAIHNTNDFKAPFDAGERPQPCVDPLDAEAGVGRHRDRRERVSDIVHAHQRHIERTERHALAPYFEPCRCARGLDIMRLPREVRPYVRCPERLHA